MSFKEKVIFNICILNNNVTFCHCCSGVKSCPTLCNFMDYSLPGSSVHGILQATGVGCHALLQGIFPAQGLNLCLLCLLGSP